ncbi:hypothetical protein AMATHDRAFT_155498 [Amanita thiersii Skay4041]|uniref:Uncharacterized protein n=1 Tax=Amanita thiersii Skay4041 TaxID=703135 RepID=A0A2A9NF16_9AGAR|nr:hypothetical protein AMATHDRAFT_155498 [Amanita thiersii Skay4041]
MERAWINEYTKDLTLPPIRDLLHKHKSNLSGIGKSSTIQLNITPLINLRRQHQTYQATVGVRTANSKPSTIVPQTTRIHRKILHELSQLLKLEEVAAPGSGVERSMRWTGTTETSTSSNIAMAAIGQETVESKVSRKHIFITTTKILLSLSVGNAGITVLRPFVIGDYSFVYTQHGLHVGHVHAIYSRSGGKNGNHMAVSSSSNITTVSNMVVQIFEPIHRRMTPEMIFRDRPERLCLLHMKEYLLITSA